MQMEGVRLMVNKGLSNHFQVSDNEGKWFRDEQHGCQQSSHVCNCCLSGESHGAVEHLGRLHLQVWYNVRWIEADGSR